MLFFKNGFIESSLARRNEELEELKKELIESGLKKEKDIFILPADLNELNKIPDLVNQALKAYGRVDILVNNAGFSMRSLAINVSFETEQRYHHFNKFVHSYLDLYIIKKQKKINEILFF